MPLLTVALSFIALLVIIGQAIIYNQQRQIMHRQAQVTEDSFRISSRAYVGVASLTANPESGTILMTLENLGKVPAKNITVQADAYLANWGGRLESFHMDDFDAGEDELFPGSLKMRVIVPMKKFDSEEIRMIREKKTKSLFIVGSIRYEDGFGYVHLTKFNFKYTPPSNDSWLAVSTPVGSMKEDIVKRMSGLPPTEVWTAVIMPYFDGSRARSLSDSTSNAAKPTAKPTVERQNVVGAKGAGCECSCAWICAENLCQFSCTDCTLSSQVEKSSQCCEAARAASSCPPGVK